MARAGSEKVYHGYAIEVGDGVPAVTNIKYRYGVLRWEEARIAAPPAPFTTVRAPMTIPEEFLISWDTKDGKHYDVKVPVRSKVPADIKGKTILFVIMQDHIEGFVATPLANFQDRLERFY
jgi:hypothetical protein